MSPSVEGFLGFSLDIILSFPLFNLLSLSLSLFEEEKKNWLKNRIYIYIYVDRDGRRRKIVVEERVQR